LFLDGNIAEFETKASSPNPSEFDGDTPIGRELKGAARIGIVVPAGEFESELSLAHAGRSLQDEDVVTLRVAQPRGNLIEDILAAKERQTAARRDIALKSPRRLSKLILKYRWRKIAGECCGS